jgi:hypothetical protein
MKKGAQWAGSTSRRWRRFVVTLLGLQGGEENETPKSRISISLEVFSGMEK